MKLVLLDMNGVVVEDISEIFRSLADAQSSYGNDVNVREAPDEVDIGWVWDENGWNEPTLDGMKYDLVTRKMYTHDEYRLILHNRTTDDTMQALRKIREGDTSIDWESWLKALDDYNVAIEDTKNQKDYPLKVVYPEYPTKPTK